MMPPRGHIVAALFTSDVHCPHCSHCSNDTVLLFRITAMQDSVWDATLCTGSSQYDAYPLAHVQLAPLPPSRLAPVAR